LKPALPNSLGPAAGWLVVLAVWLGLQLLLGSLVSFAPQLASDLRVLGACEVLLLGGAVMLLIFRSRWLAAWRRSEKPPVDWRSLAFAWPGIALVLSALVLGVALNPVADALRGAVEALSPTPAEQLGAKHELLRHDTRMRLVSLFVVVGFAGPFIEELFFRGALFGQIRRAAGVQAAAFISSAGFVFTHGDVRDWPSLLLVSGVLTWLRQRTDSLWPSVAAHAAFNTTTLVMMVVASESEWSAGFVAASGIAAVVLLVLLARTTRRP
jgi:uncharacterized protein